MCYKGNCLYCIPVETGCLVLAILSAIVSGLIVVGCIIVGFLVAVGIIVVANGVHSYTQYADPNTEVVTSTVVGAVSVVVGIAIAVATVASLIAFIFSVLLCNGICNRRPGHVKAYFVYGVVITVLATIASVVAMIADLEGPGILGLLGCVIYSLFLVLVHNTHTKLTEGHVFKDHMQLVEDSDTATSTETDYSKLIVSTE